MRALWRCVLVATAMSGSYAPALLIDLLRPRASADDPALGLFSPFMPTVPKVAFWAVLCGWAVAAIAAAATAAVPALRPGRTPIGQLTVLGTLVMSLAVWPVHVMATNLPELLLVVPTTAAGLWFAHRSQRHHRMPGRLLLGAFAWGALPAIGLAGAMNTLYLDYAPAYLQEAGNLLYLHNRVYAGAAFHAGFVEEAAKGAGVAIALLLFRRHTAGMVSGIALGAAVGLGFNFTESIEYLSSATGSAAGFQHWMRQTVGLMAAHTAFSAVLGAGLGLASQMDRTRGRAFVVTCGFLAAAGSHAASNVVFRWYGQIGADLVGAGPAVDTVLMSPVVLILVQGPCVLMVALLLRHGLREQAEGIADVLLAEARSGTGTVTPVEVPMLIVPARRFWLRVTLLRRAGRDAYRAVVAVQRAQLTLATHQWLSSQGRVPPDPAEEHRLRVRILRRRTRQAELLSAVGVTGR
ncbi:PrsW family glutamic-type intramembrane protease [Micromonospora sp. NPDC000207]|uniref:PrsW family intramembrane metalloprotease n=1 Tax=Micromonospora sp. NPDC000207 TaxID=3154246 RepID=UPI00332D4128